MKHNMKIKKHDATKPTLVLRGSSKSLRWHCYVVAIECSQFPEGVQLAWGCGENDAGVTRLIEQALAVAHILGLPLGYTDYEEEPVEVLTESKWKRYLAQRKE
jgi:hypothetical protein